LKVEVSNYIGACVACQMKTRVTKYDRVPITPVIRPVTSFEVVNLDVIGPLLPKSGRGHNYILCLIDVCTRWVEACPLKTLTARETCDALLGMFNRIGIPKVIVSDNGTNFVAGLTNYLTYCGHTGIYQTLPQVFLHIN